MRSTILFLAMVGALMMSASGQAAEPSRFLSVIDDLPMMDKMVEVGDGVAFTTPAGRIADTQATVTASRAEVLAFYKATLPQLGWSQTAEATFVREDEILNVTFETIGTGLKVRFAISPTKK